MLSKLWNYVFRPLPIFVLFVVILIGVAIAKHHIRWGRFVEVSDIPVAAKTLSLRTGVHYQVKSIKVLQAHVFDVVLDNDKRYLVALEGVPGTPPESKELVVRHLNDSREKGSKPTLVAHAWDNGKQWYLVSVYLGEGDSSLTEWLYAQNLAYCR